MAKETENQMDQELSEWMPQQQTLSQVTTEQLDQAIAEMNSLRKAYEEKKRESTEAHNQLEAAQKQVVGLLKASNKSKYEAEGVGLAYIVTKETWTVPKSNDRKQDLFNYIKAKHGPEVLMSMVGINHMTLNSWAKKELEAEPLVHIPGLEEPTSEEILHFRKRD